MPTDGMHGLVGLDFGTTTSSALVAQARVRRNASSGRMELADFRETYRSELEFTPLNGELLDLAAAERLLDRWLSAAAVDPADLLGGGALLTGLAAQRANAAGLVAAIRQRLGNTLVATADDPCLESWLAFQGSCAALSRRHPEKWFIHIDIGGGTANFALGRDGEVHATGCLLVGARHVRVEPGTHRITGLSLQAATVLPSLGIHPTLGAQLSAEEVGRIAAWSANQIVHAATGESVGGADPRAAASVQVPFLPPLSSSQRQAAVITLSGGVGELVYAAAAGRQLPPTTAFGDLGIELAGRLHDHAAWRPFWTEFIPDGGGRATVAGLLQHTTRISGTSLHLPDANLLPLADLPIVGTLRPDLADDALRHLLDLARRSTTGAGLRIEGLGTSAEAVRQCGERLAACLVATGFPADRPLVLLLESNAGKALGQCATRWGRVAVKLLVIDELDLPDARYAAIGRLRDGVVPVSFHGLRK